jgi:hypothetical protein
VRTDASGKRTRVKKDTAWMGILMRAASGGRAGVRVASTGVVLLLLATLLGSCETTAEESARLEKTVHHARLAERGLSIAKASTDIGVLGAVLVRGTEGAAAVVTLRNDSAHALRDVPIAITVKDAQGSTVFQNNAPGLETALTSLGSLPAYGVATWVDDQVPAIGDPVSVTAIVGVSPAVSGGLPEVEVASVHPSDESGSATAAGAVRNRSSVTQRTLVVYTVARRAGRVVAAGRAILPEVSPAASVPFKTFLVGSPKGAALESSAPANTFG